MQVHEIMSKAVVTVFPKATFRELWQGIFRKKVNALPVVDSRGHLLGLITKEDLLMRLYPNYSEFMEDVTTAADFELMEQKVKELTVLTAADIMSKRVIFTRNNTYIMRALSRMIARSVNQLPVLSVDDTVIGIITKGDIFYSLFKKQLSENQPVLVKSESTKKISLKKRKTPLKKKSK